ncbi:hypothetical protein HGRIS_007182 [Hohenbuehelia grisea]|uniref:F-box domain-containing protein n=1 Tax=Hohenbuehelia grisea TaxID=104357 RepID=A0ABR3JBQ1_9AGAR
MTTMQLRSRTRRPFNELAPELKIAIFTFCLPDHATNRDGSSCFTIHTLRLVCKDWRDIISESPELWSFVRICSRHPVLRDWLWLQLDQSQVSPLTVEIDGQATRKGFQKLVQQICTYAPRWKTIILFPQADLVKYLNSQMIPSFPLLECLEVVFETCVRSQIPKGILCAPKLRQLSLSSKYSLKLDGSLPSSLDVEEVRLNMPLVSMVRILRIIAPTVAVLHICEEFRYDDDALEFSILRQIRFPLVHTLQVGSGSAGFVELLENSLIFPAVRDIVSTLHGGFVLSALERLVVASNSPVLTTMALLLNPRDGRAPCTFPASQVSGLLGACPMLRQLKLHGCQKTFDEFVNLNEIPGSVREVHLQYNDDKHTPLKAEFKNGHLTLTRLFPPTGHVQRLIVSGKKSMYTDLCTIMGNQHPVRWEEIPFPVKHFNHFDGRVRDRGSFWA